MTPRSTGETLTHRDPAGPSPADGDAGDDPEATADLGRGEIHDVLRNDRRREVLTVLEGHDGMQTIGELAEHVAAVESGVEPPPRDVRQSVYVSLHQTHLPKLDELDIVAYDTDRKTIELGENAALVMAHLSPPTDNETRLTAGGILVGLIGAGTLTAAELVGLPAGIEPAAVGVVLFLLVATVSGYVHLASRSAR